MDDLANYNRELIEQFRATRGTSDDPFAERPLVLLTTTGARSGQQRTTPLMVIPDGDRLLVVASAAGAERHPAWYHNLLSHPEVTVETRTETFDATAVPASGSEREEIWSRITAQYPFFTEHQSKVQREIPVVVLSRRTSR